MGAEFIAEEGVLKGLILSLESGEEWTIGRDPDLCTIVIEDPKASRLHARLRKTDVGYSIENLSTTDPLLLNGESIKIPTILKDDDQIQIGTSTFRFYPEGAPVDYLFETESQYEEEEAETEDRPLNQRAAPFDESITEEEPSESLEEEVFGSQMPSFDQNPEEESEESHLHDTLFEESEVPQMKIDLTQTTRFILKVIAGPNTGAEFALDVDRFYLIGTDTATCDIVFNDLSVSREHARLAVNKEGVVTIQDLGSRNGVIVDKERITGTRVLTANSVVALGTSAFLLIDRESPSETIAAPLFEMPGDDEEEEELSIDDEIEEPIPTVVHAVPSKSRISPGTLVLALIIGGLSVLLGIGLVSLLQTNDVGVERKDNLAEIQAIVKKYPAVRFTYSPTNSKLFLLGHVSNGVEHNELLHQLKGLTFLKGIDDNIVNDEAVWQEMNILMSKHPEFKGVSMHSPVAGLFVVSGYLQNEKQASALNDYLNVNFNYLDILQNRVIVEASVLEEVLSCLVQSGFEAVLPTLNNGDLQLTGYVPSSQLAAYNKILNAFKHMRGIRTVRNFVVTITPDLESVIDLNRGKLGSGRIDLDKQVSDKPVRYRVTGYSKHGDVNVNVVINGRILTRGDCLDGYTITSIQPHAVFLEKEGLKYKIEYNTCNSFRGE